MLLECYKAVWCSFKWKPEWIGQSLGSRNLVNHAHSLINWGMDIQGNLTNINGGKPDATPTLCPRAHGPMNIEPDPVVSGKCCWTIIPVSYYVDLHVGFHAVYAYQQFSLQHTSCDAMADTDSAKRLKIIMVIKIPVQITVISAASRWD